MLRFPVSTSAMNLLACLTFMEQLVDQVNANGTVLELMEPPITSRFLMKSSSTKYFLLSEIWNLRPLAVTLL